jgi:hypothetical protein
VLRDGAGDPRWVDAIGFPAQREDGAAELGPVDRDTHGEPPYAFGGGSQSYQALAASRRGNSISTGYCTIDVPSLRDLRQNLHRAGEPGAQRLL